MGVSVGDLASGRSGDKGSTLDLALVVRDDAAYARLAAALPADVVAARLGAPAARRYDLPALRALKYVLPGALDAGPAASRRAGVHWQKAAISAVLSMEVPDVSDEDHDERRSAA